MKNQELDEKIKKVWSSVTARLGLEFESPVEIRIGDRCKNVFAMVSHRASGRKVIICLTAPPHFDTDAEVIAFCQNNNIQWSFINRESDESLDEQSILSALSDWGYGAQINGSTSAQLSS